MKNNIFAWMLGLLCIICNLTSCSNSPDPDPDDDNPNLSSQDKKQIEAVNDVCLNWGESMSSVDAYMEKYEKINTDGSTSIYKSEKHATFFTYQFDNNCLIAAAVIFDKVFEEQSIASNLKNFEYFARLDGSAIYSNEDKNTFCNIAETSVDDVDYSIVGFTPINSDYFENYENIAVEIADITSITDNSARINCTVSGSPVVQKAGVVVSTNSDFSDKKTVSGKVTGETLSVNLTNLTHDTKYWCYAYITSDGVTYKSNPMSFETAHVDTYEVGDFYPKNDIPQGVVFSVDASGIHGRMVALSEAHCKWENVALFGEGYMGNYNNTSDGEKSKLPSNSSLNDYIKSLGAGWYCPSKGELKTLSNVVNKVNNTLNIGGFTPLDGFYYSCNEYNNYPNGICVYVVTLCGSNGYMGYSNGYTFYVSKDNSERGRGIKKF